MPFRRERDEDLLDAGHDDDDAPQRPRKRKAAPQPVAKEAVPKFSFEASADVQRWLKLQEQSFESGKSRPPFNPTFLAGRRDAMWIQSSLEYFYDQEMIDDVVREVKSGKEATVYCCVANPATHHSLLAAKVYRPRMFRALSNDAVYRNSRELHDDQGNTVRDRRRPRPGGAKGRAFQVSSWIQYEFGTQQALHAAGAPVPVPFAQMGNAVLMEFVGDETGAAPLLRSVRIDRSEAGRLFDRLVQTIEIFLSCDRIHGDLSAYNILYWKGDVVVIDLAQALDPRHSDAVYPLLERDVARVYEYFAPYGVKADPKAIAGDMWARYLVDEL
jgi:RIO kinase 1